MWKPSIILMALLPVPVLVSVLPQEEPTPFDAKGYPPQMRELAVLTTNRCVKCHTIKRVIRSRTTGDEWIDTVEMMQEKARSGISTKEAEKIGSFLVAWSTWSPGKKPEKPKTTSPPAKAADAALFPRVSHTVAHTAQVPPEVQLPHRLELGSVGASVEDVRAQGDGTITVDVNVADQRVTLALPKSGSDAATPRTHVLKTWKVGQHPFRLELALIAADTSTPPRPTVWLATIVVRPNRISPQN